MIGQGFAIAKRHVAMFCVGLCVALSVQMTVVVLDRMKHVFQIDHAPTALAGPVFDHGHHLTVDVRHIAEQDHQDDHHLAVVHGDHDHDVQPVADHTHGQNSDGHAPDIQQVAYHTHEGVAPHAHDHDAAPHSHDHDATPPSHDHDATPPAHDHDAAPHADDHDSAPIGFHTHDGLPQGHDHGPITHHHHGSGMLTPWLISASLQIAIVPVKITVVEFGVTGHPDAPAWRRDRPPKLDLERIV